MLRWVLVVVFVAGLGFLPNLARASDDPVARLDEMILAKDFDNAVKVAREAAEAGNVEVQFRLGVFFWHGVGLTQNYLEALRWTTLFMHIGLPSVTARVAC